MNVVEQRPLFPDGLSKLTKHRDLREFLTAALHEAIQASKCQGASVLLVSDRVVRLKEGDLSPEIEDQISRWEDSLQQRLRTASWRIGGREPLPITTHSMKDTQHLLVNTPLLHDEEVTGSLTLVFAPGHTLSLSQRQVLTSCASNVGNLAKIIEQLTTTQDGLRQLSFLYETSQALISTLDLREVLNNTMELATKILNASASTLMLLKEDTKELVLEIAHGQKREVLRRYHTGVDSGIAGWVATHGEPAIVNDVTRDERFSREVDARTGLLTQSVLCVPLQIRKRTIGVLEVLNKISVEGFTEDDLRLLSTLAAQAAIAIENARLYRNLREERDKIIQAQEEARRELARDLHDSTVQSVSSLAMHIDYIRRLLEREPEKAIEELEQLQAKAIQASAEARALLFKLRPVVLETRGLVRALEAHVEHLQGEKPPIFHFNDGGFTGKLSDEVETTAFIIVQEAIRNATKHAEAENIWLNLAHDEEHLLIAVEDDGFGFDLEAVRETQDESRHLGFLSMQERAELIDGQLKIQSKPGQGTKLVLEVPLTAPKNQSREPAGRSSPAQSSTVS